MCLGHRRGVTLTGAGQRVIPGQPPHTFARTQTHMDTLTKLHVLVGRCLAHTRHAGKVSLYKHYSCTSTRTQTLFMCFFSLLLHILYSHPASLSLSLSHTPLPSLLQCEKPQPHNEPQICPVNWCSHTQIQTHTCTKCQSDSTFTSIPRRKKTPTSHPAFLFYIKYSLCVCVRI